ncbi:unnamed protein product [Fusarium venenatum]|uniref:Uncharacterized protein n=1 Tax=Fusarium venenatum TaxID=56646 RepID=A0A2L2TL35_9HYPO|nr:uncharacterized protein FVRRES_05506 [Fusarium venenatum]CEI61070.1 unnamed protein product [Fusarium venenatum]
MDFVKNLAGGNKNDNADQTQQQTESGGFMDKASFLISIYVNNMAGGGASGEKKEDGLDKGKITIQYSQSVDYVQENFLGAGNQSNESAAEQMKDEAISDAIRDQYKGATGSEFPIADK